MHGILIINGLISLGPLMYGASCISDQLITVEMLYGGLGQLVGIFSCLPFGGMPHDVVLAHKVIREFAIYVLLSIVPLLI